ncbi:MAG: hypothetical protein AAGF11_32550 [Myxococcota bacterium]
MPDLQHPGSFPSSSIYGGPYRESSALPTGEWHVMANGRIYALKIVKVSGGQVEASLTSGEVSAAKWSASERILVFTRSVPGQVEQEWTGYLMAYSAKDPKWRIAGTLRNVRSLGEHSVPLGTSGWYATRPR